MLPKLLWLMLWTTFACSQPQWKHLDLYEDCVNRWINRKPNLLSRFNRKQIAWLCERTDAWQHFSNILPDARSDDQMTRKQRAWLNTIRFCKGEECLAGIQRKGDNGKEFPPISRSSENSDSTKIKPRPRSSDQSLLPTPPPNESPLITSNQTDDPVVQRFVQARKELSSVEPSTTQRAVETTTTTELAAEFESLDLRNINLRIVPAADDLTEFDQQLLLEGSAGPKCAIRRLVAQLCPRVMNNERSHDIFHETILSLELGGRETRRRLMKLQSKLRNFRRKCFLIDDLLPPDTSFQYLASCASPSLLQEQRFNISEKCTQILHAVSAEEAFGEKNSEQRQFARWTEACLNFQAKLKQYKLGFDSWKPKANNDRTQRDPRQPLNLENKGQRVTRKEYRQMTDDERVRFQKALNQLKTDEIDRRSKYDLLVIYHTPQESPGSHWGPAFLPFHRELLKQLEIALRQIDPDVYIPYWDSTLDEGLPDPRDAILWTDEFLGNGDGKVTSGPFSNWSTTHELGTVPNMYELFRDVGSSPYGGLFKESDWEFAITRNSYNDFTACVDPTFELLHGIVHMFVGGYMADSKLKLDNYMLIVSENLDCQKICLVAISPNDPAFFMHHAFIDHMWEEFRMIQQTEEQREVEYPPNDKACSNYHHGDHQMLPFPLKNIEGLSNNYTTDLYRYYPRPRCSDTVPSCGSKYLFCDTREYRCLSKIRDGGNCTGFEGTDICYTGICNHQGICEDSSVSSMQPTTTIETTTEETTAVPTFTTASEATDFSTSAATTTISIPRTTTETMPESSTVGETTTPLMADKADITTATAATTTPAEWTTTTTPMSTTGFSTTVATSTSTQQTSTDTQQTTSTVATTTTTTHITTAEPKATTTTISDSGTPTASSTSTTASEPITATTMPTKPITVTPDTPTATTSTKRQQSTATMATTTTTSTKMAPPKPTTPLTPTIEETTTSEMQTTVKPVGSEGHTGAPFPVIWFTVTIVRGSIFFKNPVPGATVSSRGLNMPTGYTQALHGRVLEGTTYPEYTTGALVQVMDPDKAGFSPIVQASVEVFDEHGRPCRSYCYSASSKRYAECENQVRISSNQFYANPIEFRKTPNEALKALWKPHGSFRRHRIPDYMMFKCQ